MTLRCTTPSCTAPPFAIAPGADATFARVRDLFGAPTGAMIVMHGAVADRVWCVACWQRKYGGKVHE